LDKILATVRVEGKIALAVASSGIAVVLLIGGRTAHSRVKLSLDLTSTSTCNISEQSSSAKLLQQTSLIVWNEAPMMHRFAFEAVHLSLQLMRNDLPLGGKVVLPAGDVRQILPVVPRSKDCQIISACLKKSQLWQHFEVLRITTNMRVHTAQNPGSAAEIQKFLDFLLKVGEGRHGSCSKFGRAFVKVPRDLVVKPAQRNKPILSLIDWLYGDTERRLMEPDYFAKRMIVTPINGAAQEINEEVIQKLPGDIQEYLSIDAVEQNDMEHGVYPVEFLNTLTISGMPTHKPIRNVLNCVLFEQIKGMGTYTSEYATRRFPRVEVMHLPIIAFLGRNRSTVRRREEKKK
jgi:ATP-dependent DNA helicase PIF1